MSPDVSRTNVDVALVTAKVDLLEVLKVDVDTGCGREALVGSVASCLNTETDALLADDLDGGRDIGGRGGDGDTSGCLGGRSHVVLDEAEVGKVKRVDDLAAWGGHGAGDSFACIKLGRVDKALLH